MFVSNQNSTGANEDDERLQLVKREQIIVFTPKLRSRMIYEISEELEAQEKCEKRTETCI